MDNEDEDEEMTSENKPSAKVNDSRVADKGVGKFVLKTDTVHISSVTLQRIHYFDCCIFHSPAQSL